tara:strand:- start:35713 stop:36387 length:675 start_codon:yes stop_codon:yes gene_type:complete
MRIDIVTIFPEFFNPLINHSIIKRSIAKKKVEIYTHNIRDFSNNKQKSIDDYQFGGDAGMVLQVQPIDDCISKLKAERVYCEIIYLSPCGKTLNQIECNRLSVLKNIILLCGNYKGIDQRAIDLHVTKEVSIGDYVLTGGEFAASILLDSVIRLIPGVISNESSALFDSFQDNLLAPPIYSRPSTYKNLKVPKVLLSGNSKKIEEWKEKQIIKITKNKRPDLLD